MNDTTVGALAVVQDPGGVAALLSPLRRRILAQLHRQTDSAAGLAHQLGLARQKINYHLRTLESAGLVELVELRRRRGCTERRLRPTARAYLISADFLEELAADPRDLKDRFSSDYLISLASRLVQEVAGLREAAARLNQRLPTLALQLDVSFDSAAARSRFAQELTDALAGLAARYQSRSSRSRPYRFMVGGHPRIQDKDVRPPGEEK